MSTEAVRQTVAGSDNLPVDLTDKIGQMATRVGEIAEQMAEAKETDTARYDALKAQLAEDSAALTELKNEHDKTQREREVDEAIKAAKVWQETAATLRSPSKAHLIGAGSSEAKEAYEAGEFLFNVFRANHQRGEIQREGEVALSGISKGRIDAEGKAVLSGGPLNRMSDEAKSTLGTTDATGGWIIPNAVVDAIIKPATVRNPYRELMTVRSGINAAAVDLPFRAALPSRAVIAPAGQTKENRDLAYNGYTVTLFTLAAIYDIGNQFLRTSRGAAEQDVLEELATAFALGEAHYIREGTGSSEPFGYTSALTNGPAAFRSTFTPSASTLAGSILTSIATAAGALAGRGQEPNGAVLAATSYWTMASQGLDGTGFFYAPANGPRDIRPGTILTPWGLPVFPDASADIDGTAAVIDNLVVADFKKFKIFLGQNYRVDSSDVAGTRWDTNLTGFRGEEELGFDARPAVYAGAAQLITDVLP